MPTMAMISSKAIILPATPNLFRNMINSSFCAGVGTPPDIAIAFAIFSIRKLAGRLTKNPIKKALIASKAPTVSTIPFSLIIQAVCNPADIFHINSEPASTVIIAINMITIGKRFVLISCCMNFAPSGPDDLTAGSTKKAR